MCTEKNYKDRDRWHPMSPLEILAIQNQTNLFHLEKSTHILGFERTKGQALNGTAIRNAEYSLL